MEWKTFTIILCSILIIQCLTSSINQSSIIDETITQKIDLNVLNKIKIPVGYSFKGLEVSNWDYDKKQMEKPTIIYYTTDDPQNNQDIGSIVYEESYNYEIVIKNDDEYIYFFAPSVYYSDGYEYTTTNMDVDLIVEKEEPVYKSTYETQASTYDYVIITNETMYPVLDDSFVSWKISDDAKISSILMVNVSDITSNSSFWVNGTWGDATNATGGNSWIPNGKQVVSNFDLFNDTQAMIRNFIRFCNVTYSSKYFLIGGNKDIVPVRMIATRASGDGCSNFDNDLSHASDMYYSNLHYCMNNNTNSYFMESECCGYDWDEVDWGFDVVVGRAVVGNTIEMNYWINKTKEYVNKINRIFEYSIVSAKNNGGSITNQTWNIIGDDFPSNLSFINNQNISQAQWDNIANYCNGDIDGVNSIQMIFHSGHGGTLWTPYQPVNLDNAINPNFVYTEGCHSADFGTDTSSRMESWISDDGASYAGIANSAYGWFIASTYYVEEMLNNVFNNSAGNHTLCLAEAHNSARETVGHTSADGVFAMIYKETNFFGDPSLEYQWYTPIEFISIDNGLNGTVVHSSNPIFNWTRISDVSQYNLQISTTSDFSSLIINITDVCECNYPTFYDENSTRVSFTLPSFHSLPVVDTYFCRVRYSYVSGNR